MITLNDDFATFLVLALFCLQCLTPTLVNDYCVLWQAQEEAAAQIQEMFSFITKEEESYTKKGS